MNKYKISSLSRSLLLIAGVMLIIALFVPLWSIYLDAPQYPEGLSLQIWPHKIAGDVDIINGLNHYIGMKTLHTKDFVEFSILPYLIGFFAVLFILSAWLARKKWLYAAFTAFLIFGIVSMIDFWKWEYDYGHNLDPNAAIKVPGMAYQPPLIGFKQLLNFGAYSIPDIGGWLFISAGLLVLIAVAIEANWFSRFKRKNTSLAMLSIIFLFASCSSNGPGVVNLNKDACEFCKMTISDAHFMAQFQTKKGRQYKFDDISCMLSYTKAGDNSTFANFYIANYEKTPEFIDATKAFYITDATFKSPMGGNTAAFTTESAANEFAKKNNSGVKTWEQLSGKNIVTESHH